MGYPYLYRSCWRREDKFGYAGVCIWDDGLICNFPETNKELNHAGPPNESEDMRGKAKSFDSQKIRLVNILGNHLIDAQQRHKKRMMF